MNNNRKLISFFYGMLFAFIIILSIFVEIYAWSFPEKTSKQVTLDLFNGKIVRYFYD